MKPLENNVMKMYAIDHSIEPPLFFGFQNGIGMTEKML
jgi:hypothetical protein